MEYQNMQKNLYKKLSFKDSREEKEFRDSYERATREANVPRERYPRSKVSDDTKIIRLPRSCN
jgi:hypothetical protein